VLCLDGHHVGEIGDRARDALRDFARGLARDWRDELRLPWRRDLELDVDAVGEQPRDPAPVACDALGRAATVPAAVAAVPAGAKGRVAFLPCLPVTLNTLRL